MLNTQDAIISMSKKYNFYPLFIQANIKLWDYELHEWGFMIFGKNRVTKGWFNIEYIFILPQYRRKKIFTQIFEDLKTKYDVISFTTSEYSMVRFASKENMKNMGKTRSGRELWFVWSEKYCKEELMKAR